MRCILLLFATGSSSLSNNALGKHPSSNFNPSSDDPTLRGTQEVTPTVSGVVSTRHGQSIATFKFDHDEFSGKGISKDVDLLASDSRTVSSRRPQPTWRVLLYPQSFVRQMKQRLSSTFMPIGFPKKTPPGYLRYCVFSWIQDLSTNLRSVVATQRVLEGIGVGRDGASALSASLNFIARDGAGMASSLVFSSLASSRFRSDIKRWRLFADLIVDVGITLEATATLVPQAFFLPMICFGNICKSICGVAAGACGGAINLHWAKGSDISDVNAKFGAQHTITGGLGLVLAALFARSVSYKSPHLVWTLYIILTAVHILANVECMKLIAFDRLNNVRFDMLLSSFAQQWLPAATQTDNIDSNANDIDNLSLLSSNTFSKWSSNFQLNPPAVVAQKERLFFFPNFLYSSSPTFHIHLAVSFNDFVRHTERSPIEMKRISEDGQKHGYIVGAGFTKGCRKVPAIYICSFAGATQSQIGKAYCQAWLLSLLLSNNNTNTEWNTLSGEAQRERINEMEVCAAKQADEMWPCFISSATSSGWDTTQFDLWGQGYEIELLQTK